ncbi:uncharacterized protein SPSK_11035 [Sporothrix schenckii 1099-18]|uniref:Uncharacterized protein n=1 Tax=Sporothrix schenckii 1099-18 TaxID=1397361 RepID=A0A0F2MEE7_SPOSC|nr:uncharacterized protein SPSK_11035 [Sporothrix schenckii 1099-18]KJR88053.1 hypothetical protein SPSK_11035 [Sporothrix schenckii 1099-18]
MRLGTELPIHNAVSTLSKRHSRAKLSPRTPPTSNCRLGHLSTCGRQCSQKRSSFNLRRDAKFYTSQ